MPVTIQQLDLLWERGDPHEILTRRFAWRDAEIAAHAIVNLMQTHYTEQVLHIERLSISAYNLITWLETERGPRIWKAATIPFVPQPIINAFVHLNTSHLQRFGIPVIHQRIRNATALQVWLADQNIPVARVFPTLHGEYQPFVGKLTFSLHEQLDGSHLDPTNPAELAQVGALLARLHTTLADYPQQNHYRVSKKPRWIAKALKYVPRWSESRADQTEWQARCSRIQAIDWATLPSGLCHNDIRAANILGKNSQIQAVLDWEEAGWNHYIVELARTAIFGGTLYRNWRPLNATQRETLLTSYQTIRPLTPQEQAILPDLTQLMLALMACEWGLDV